MALWVKIGNEEFKIKFHVIDGLVTMALLGSKDTKLNVDISCGNHTIRFGNSKVRAHSVSKQSSVYVKKNYTLQPGEHKLVTCKPSKKVLIRDNHLAKPIKSFSDFGFEHIMDIKGIKSFEMCMSNLSNKAIKINRKSIFANITPVSDLDMLEYLDMDDTDYTYSLDYETCNATHLTTH